MFQSKPTKIRIVCAGAVLLPGVVPFATCAESGDEISDPSTVSRTDSFTERFKAFIAAPPVVENLVFRKKLREDLTKPPLYDGSFSKSTNFALFRAVWQKAALLLFQPTNEVAGPAYLPGKTIVSIFNGEHLLLETGKYLETCTAPFGSFDNSVTTGIFFSLTGLNQVLQGGLMHVRPGNITWSRNRLVVKDGASPHKPGFRVEGELFESEGRPLT